MNLADTQAAESHSTMDAQARKLFLQPINQQRSSNLDEFQAASVAADSNTTQDEEGEARMEVRSRHSKTYRGKCR